MIKNNFKILILTSIIIILPILAGVVLWDMLPEEIAIHWDINGEADKWGSKSFTVFGMPLIFLAFQWFTIIATISDPKKQNQPKKIRQLLFWLIPILGIIISSSIYSIALGKNIQIEIIAPILLGLLFVALGNYMPKCKHNYTFGFKLPWTLNSEENWNRTHRFAGWVWVAGGISAMILGVFVNFIAIIPIILLMAIIPTVYSFILYCKNI